MRAQILLDFGLAEELTPRVRKHFISFLHAISKGDGAAGTRHMLAFGKQQSCPDPTAFEADMTDMFRRECNIYSRRGVDVDLVQPTLFLLPLFLPCLGAETKSVHAPAHILDISRQLSSLGCGSTDLHNKETRVFVRHEPGQLLCGVIDGHTPSGHFAQIPSCRQRA